MKNRLPNYRFNNFLDSWNIEKVSTIANEFKSGGTPSTKVMNYWNGKIPWLQSSDIQKNILFGVKPQKFISEEGLQNSSAKLISKNSIAIVTRVGVGKLAIIEQDYATSQDFLSLSDFNGDIQFIVYSIYRILQKESTQLQGTSIKGITKEDLLSKKISVPEIEEQSAIGSLFRTLDDLLASYKDNLANYQSLKATMLSKMFPKVGQTVPEIRLDGFEGEWEIKKFKSISTKRGKSNRNGDDYPSYSVSNQNGLIPQSEQFEGSRLENLEKTSYKIVEPNEFAYNPARINVGSIAFNDLDETVIVSSLYVIFSLDKSINNNYALLFIKSPEFNKEVRRNTEGSVREYLFYENFANIRIPIPPSLEEQQAISAYFSNLDNLINSYQDKISQLETLKKKLLQDIFI